MTPECTLRVLIFDCVLATIMVWTVLVTENKSVTGKMSSFFLRLAGRDSDPDNTRRLHVFANANVCLFVCFVATPNVLF